MTLPAAEVNFDQPPSATQASPPVASPGGWDTVSLILAVIALPMSLLPRRAL